MKDIQQEDYFGKERIKEFTDNYVQALYYLSRLADDDDYEQDEYELLAYVTKYLAGMANAFQQMHTSAYNLNRRLNELEVARTGIEL